MKRQSGFTLLELIVTMAVLAILAGIAIPGFTAWLPNYRLRSAALDVFSNFQQAKVLAVRANRDHRVEFNQPANDQYQIKDCGAGTCSDGDEDVVKIVDLDNYGNPGEVSFGGGDATINVPGSGPVPGTGVSYGSNIATFNPRGMGNAGYVYIQNTKGTSYAIGKESSGLIKMRKWGGVAWKK
jgi:prepilin-type N-terminal cleavage/methylation domain-containing protein